MKAETIYLLNEYKLDEAISKLRRCELGNGFQMVLSNADVKTVRQHKYQRRLYNDISQSGMGGRHEETPESVHRFCKYEFALPIILEKDINFAWLYESVKKELFNDKEKMIWFVDSQVSTMTLTVNEAADYITKIINYYAPKGFPLTDPSEYRLTA